jgi:hypothetical protein
MIETRAGKIDDKGRTHEKESKGYLLISFL